MYAYVTVFEIKRKKLNNYGVAVFHVISLQLQLV